MKKLSKDIIIRRATKADLNKIANLLEKQGMYHARLDPLHKRVSRTRPIINKFLRASLYSPKSLLLVAEVNGKIVGFSRAHLGVRPPIFSVRKYGHIDDIYIIPAYRRKRIAEQLLLECNKWFCKKGMAFVDLSVHIRNKLGQNAWKKHGFKDAVMHMRKRI